MNASERRYVSIVGVLGVGLGVVGIWGNFLPSLVDCRENGHDQEFVGNLRRSYVSSWALALGIGGIVSAVDGSLLPLATAAGAGVVMNYTYEQELPAHHRMTSPLELFKVGQSSSPDQTSELFKTNGKLLAANNWGV